MYKRQTIDIKGEGSFALIDAAGDEAFRVTQHDGTIAFNDGDPIDCPDARCA